MLVYRSLTRGTSFLWGTISSSSDSPPHIHREREPQSTPLSPQSLLYTYDHPSLSLVSSTSVIERVEQVQGSRFKWRSFVGDCTICDTQSRSDCVSCAFVHRSNISSAPVLSVANRTHPLRAPDKILLTLTCRLVYRFVYAFLMSCTDNIANYSLVFDLQPSNLRTGAPVYIKAEPQLNQKLC